MLAIPPASALLLSVVALAILGFKWVSNLATTYELTDDRLILHRGILVKSIDEIELYRVKDVRLDFTIINQMAGIGTIGIASSDETTRNGLLAIRDVEFSPIHGGSFILYVYREENPIAESPAVAAAVAAEEAAGQPAAIIQNDAQGRAIAIRNHSNDLAQSHGDEQCEPAVIASKAKQSRSCKQGLDCFVAFGFRSRNPNSSQ